MKGYALSVAQAFEVFDLTAWAEEMYETYPLFPLYIESLSAFDYAEGGENYGDRA